MMFLVVASGVVLEVCAMVEVRLEQMEGNKMHTNFTYLL